MAGCTVVEGHARFEAPGRVRIGEGVTCSATRLHHLGGRTSVPGHSRRHEVPFLNNRSMLELDRLPEHLVVVGGRLAPTGRSLLIGSRPMSRVSRAVEKGETTD